MARTDPQVNIRMQADLKQKLEAAAKDSGRSLNAEMVARLGSSFDAPVASIELLPILTRLEYELANREMEVAYFRFKVGELARIATLAMSAIPEESREDHLYWLENVELNEAIKEGLKITAEEVAKETEERFVKFKDAADRLTALSAQRPAISLEGSQCKDEASVHRYSKVIDQTVSGCGKEGEDDHNTHP